MSYDNWHRKDHRPNRYASRLRSIRLGIGLTIPQSAALAGLDPIVYAGLETGTVTLTAPVAHTVATALGIEPTQFFYPD